MRVSRDICGTVAICGFSVLVGWTNVKTRTDLPWIADPPPPDTGACAAEAAEYTLPRLPLSEAKRLFQSGVAEDFYLVDARSPEAYLAGHIPGAESLPAATAPKLLEVQSLPIPPDRMVITYCDGGECALSEGLAYVLQQDAGCNEVWILEGGFSAWLRAGLPVAVGAQAGTWPERAQNEDLKPPEETTP